MNVRHQMRSLHMGCGESLQRALPEAQMQPVPSKPKVADKLQPVVQERKPRC